MFYPNVGKAHKIFPILSYVKYWLRKCKVTYILFHRKLSLTIYPSVIDRSRIGKKNCGDTSRAVFEAVVESAWESGGNEVAFFSANGRGGWWSNDAVYLHRHEKRKKEKKRHVK